MAARRGQRPQKSEKGRAYVVFAFFIFGLQTIGFLATIIQLLRAGLMEARTDYVGLQDITRIWSSFHFLPYDLYAPVKRVSRAYRNKYRLICRPNAALVSDTVELAKKRGTLVLFVSP